MALTGDYVEVVIPDRGKYSEFYFVPVIGNAVLKAMKEHPDLPVVVRWQENKEEDHDERG